jgi:two-component system cell cycle sensor histidine kinase/response regulator CckA
MQELTQIWWTVSLGTIAMLVIAVGLIMTVMLSKQKELVIKRKQLEEIAASERKYKNLFEHSPAGMVRLTVDGWNVADANHALHQMLHAGNLEEVRQVLSTMPPDDRENLMRIISVDRTVEDYKTLLKRRDGSDLWISFSASRIASEVFLEAVIIDITSRLEAEEKINEQARLLDLALDAILVLDLDKKVRYWNAGAERVYGYGQREIIGKEVTGLICIVEHNEEFIRACDTVLKQSEWSGELNQRKKDGTFIITDCRWNLVRDAGGRPSGILQVCTDVTERKRMESKFLRAQRVESIGIFASGIAHDLNNTLSPVLVGVEVLKRKFRDRQSRRLLRTIESSARYGTEMVYQVLSFVKGIKGTHVKLNPWKIVKDLSRVFIHILPRNIIIHARMPKRLPPIFGDATQLHQVLINLCTNARDAMPEGGTLTFSAESTYVTGEMARELPDAVEGQYILFGIGDTGNGISKENLNKIFEPFYTTKEIGQGTGLGLSICHGIIKGHKGFMTVDSVEGKGTTFRIYLPVMDLTRKEISPAKSNGEFRRKVFFIANSENENTQALIDGLEDHGYELMLAVGKSQVNDVLIDNLDSSDIAVLEGFAEYGVKTVVEELLEYVPRARLVIISAEFGLDEKDIAWISQPRILLRNPVSVEMLLEAIEKIAAEEVPAL